MRIIYALSLAFIINTAAAAKIVRVPADVKDLSTAIENCQSGDTIWIAPKYIYGKGVFIKQNVSIMCESADAIISNPTGPGILVSGDTSSFSMTGVTVKGCMDDGVRIQGNQIVTCAFTKVNLVDNYGAGLNCGSDIHLKFEDSNISNNIAEGVRVYGALGKMITGDISISRCALNKNKTDAVLMHHCAPCRLALSDSKASNNSNAIHIDLAQGDSSSTITVESCSFSKNKNSIYVNGNRNVRAGAIAGLATVAGCNLDGSTSSGLKLFGTQNLIWRVEKTKLTGNRTAIELNRLNCPSLSFNDSAIQENIIGLCTQSNDAASVPIQFANSMFKANKTADYLVMDPIVISCAAASAGSTVKYILSEAARIRIDGPLADGFQIKPDPLLNRLFLLKLTDATFETIDKKSGPYWLSYCRTSAQICNHLNQARDWADLGDITNAYGSLLSAKKLFSWMGDRSFSMELLKPLRDEIRATESILKKRNHAPADKIVKYSDLMTLYDQYQRFPERIQPNGPSFDVSKYRDQVMQLALTGLVDALKSEPAHSQRYSEFIQKCLSIYYDNSDVTKMLAWTEQNIDLKKLKEPMPNGQNYHMFMADQYNRLGSFDDELRHLTKIIDTYSTAVQSAYMVNVINRATDVYVIQSNKPDDAVRVQRYISKYYPSTEYDYNSRLRIAKIVMDDKKYEQAITEINELLKALPKEYQDIPVRTLLGLALIGASRYDEARNELAGVQNKDTGEYRERALYLIAYSYIIEQKYSEAVRPFTDLVNLYPKGQYTAQAKDFLSKLQENKAK